MFNYGSCSRNTHMHVVTWGLSGSKSGKFKGQCYDCATYKSLPLKQP